MGSMEAQPASSQQGMPRRPNVSVTVVFKKWNAACQISKKNNLFVCAAIFEGAIYSCAWLCVDDLLLPALQVWGLGAQGQVFRLLVGRGALWNQAS